jgi:hypothetical protein
MDKATFYKSMTDHQIKCSGTSWFSLPVVLEASDNKYISYPSVGVIRFAEQATDLNITNAIFHQMAFDGQLGAPVSVKNPKFRYDPR